jgi:hypothetical protein
VVERIWTWDIALKARIVTGVAKVP